MKVLDGVKASKEIEKELKNKIKDELELVIIQINDDKNSNIHIKNIIKKCDEFNIRVTLKNFYNEKEEEIINYIKKINDNPKVNGIIIDMPIIPKYNAHRIINMVAQIKDVDGQTDENMIKLMNNDSCFVPCTVLGIENILKYYKIDISEKKVTIINRSNVIGKPLLFRLLHDNCTVTLCHSKTKDLKNICKQSEIIITAIGKKHYLNKEYISKNQIIIDAGITTENNKVYGDVATEVQEDCLYITKVPGGVGQMTTISLIENLYKAYQIQNKK
ncbi:MAG: bifunctional 5,10-methylenetetrahydrofolate dehydrogenase/5,10-methenyltetrahydrofolate cyclohydrolase [Bacilli bacterium]|nr:bifunctional 5,10-methylenetetrahydrofolate dehydrogenase/5,10-methenyltetrahydrofolate cyclohydrolase [Bacilli bacterium]MBR3209871.1 bifunctional 5,10-methylenetetrahydrofolate dehydrogenase/5,10-methenyltetrahydrofolate cyclohydrolase [Bacilli bacterium]